MTVLLSAGVESAYWYLLKDYDQFAGMGLLRDDNDALGAGGPTPAFVSYATLIRMLDHATFQERIRTDARTHLYRFERDDKQVQVAWATDARSTLVFEADAPVTRVTFMGRTETLDPERGSIRLDVGQEPLFLLGPARLIQEIRPDEVIAGSSGDFSLEQGYAYWTYGARIGSGARAAQLVPLTDRTDMWGVFWALDGDGHLKIDGASMHPSERAGTPIAAVRRWTSPVSRAATISGRIARSSSDGDGTGVRLRVDERILFDRVLGSGEQGTNFAFTYDVKLEKGSVLEIEVTPGPAADINFDSVQLDFEVTGKKL
jgi:hypothetical protein